MQSIRIHEIPDCKMVSSGTGMFGDGILEKFDEWFSAQPKGIFPRDFLFWDSSPEKQGVHWLCIYEPGMNVPDCFSVIDFRGGLYAVATDIDGQTDMDAMNASVDAFLSEHCLCRDASRAELGHVITSPLAREALGYEQMDHWFPVTKKA